METFFEHKCKGNPATVLKAIVHGGESETEVVDDMSQLGMARFIERRNST